MRLQAVRADADGSARRMPVSWIVFTPNASQVTLTRSRVQCERVPPATMKCLAPWSSYGKVPLSRPRLAWTSWPICWVRGAPSTLGQPLRCR